MALVHSTPAGPGENRPTVVDEVRDIGGGLYRVHIIDPEGGARWIQIPAGKATLEFVTVSAAAYNWLLVRNLVAP